ncbi:hypothetical protein HZS_2315, partial [Henneguya salminicola]
MATDCLISRDLFDHNRKRNLVSKSPCGLEYSEINKQKKQSKLTFPATINCSDPFRENSRLKVMKKSNKSYYYKTIKGDVAKSVKKQHKKAGRKLGAFQENRTYNCEQLVNICTLVVNQREEELCLEYTRILDDILK